MSDARPADIPAVVVDDLRAWPHRLRPSRWDPSRRRDPSRFRGVVLHQWATDVGTTAKNRRAHGPARALALRALEAPYTISCGVDLDGTPVVAIAHPLERYTHSSDAGCAEYVSIGVMGRFPFEDAGHVDAKHSARSPAMRAAVAAAMTVAARLLDEAGALDGRVITHRQCANGPRDHLQCPGEFVVAAALASDAVRLGGLRPDPDLVLVLVPPHGRPWPESWRRHLRRREDDLGVDAPLASTLTEFGVPHVDG